MPIDLVSPASAYVTRSITLDPALDLDLCAEASRQGVPLAVLYRRLISEYVEAQKAAREAAKEAAK